MKLKVLFLFAIIVCTTATYSQSTIDSCSKKTDRKDLKVKDVNYFQAQGLDLTKYDWNNSDVNCHVNLMVKEYHIYKGRKAGGWTYIGLAALLFPLGAAISSQGDGELAAYYYVGGSVSIGLSVFSFLNAPKHRDKMYYHMTEIKDYYNTP